MVITSIWGLLAIMSLISSIMETTMIRGY
jgi:hypothetical protein